MIITYINTMCSKEVAEIVKKLESEKLGVNVNIKQVKIGNCVQMRHKNVKVTITDCCIGKTCNGDEFFENEQKVKQFLRSNYFEFSQF